MFALLLALIGTTAWSGPLLLPDPNDMGAYRCKDHPVDLDNNTEISGEFAVAEDAPGAPTFAGGVKSGLLPIATDTDLKAAAKGKGVYALPSVVSLATGGEAVRLACEPREATDQDFFFFGCKKPKACDLLLRLDGKTTQIEQRDEVGARLANPRVDDVKTALGLVALLDPSVFLPLTPAELTAWSEAAAQYTSVTPAIDWVEFEEREEGFVVRAPRRAICGCEQDVVRRAWWVSRDGRSCQLEETPVPLAKAAEGLCAG